MGATHEGAGAAAHTLSILCSKPPYLRCTTFPLALCTHGDGGLFLTHFVQHWSVLALPLESLQIFASICQTCRVGGCWVIFLHTVQIQFSRVCLPWEAAA